MMSMLSIGKKKPKIKTIAVYPETYVEVLSIKGEMEMEEGRVLPMNMVIKNLVRWYRETKGKTTD